MFSPVFPGHGRYEDLVREPAKVMDNLCKFLGVPFEEAVLHPYEGRRMIDGPGDPDILQHDKIDPTLGEVWKTIKLPRQLSEYSRNLAAELNYELPHDVDEIAATIEKINRENAEQLLANLDQLSDEQVEASLNKMLANKEEQDV